MRLIDTDIAIDHFHDHEEKLEYFTQRSSKVKHWRCQSSASRKFWRGCVWANEDAPKSYSTYL